MDSFGAKASLGLCLKQFEILRGEILICVYFGVILANSPGGNCKKWMRKKPTSGALHSPEAAESKNLNDWFVPHLHRYLQSTPLTFPLLHHQSFKSFMFIEISSYINVVPITNFNISITLQFF